MRWFSSFLFAGLLAAQTAPPSSGNADVIQMIRSGIPDQAIATSILTTARQGRATFDISPQALIELKRAGASAQVLETLMVAQTQIIPGLGAASVRGVYFESANGRAALQPLLLWAPIRTRTVAWPIERRRRSVLALDESSPALAVGSGNPAFRVEGFSPGADWQIVQMHGRSVELRRKSAYSSDFLSNAIFQSRDTRSAMIIPTSGDAFSIRPSAPLGPGVYALCGQLQEGGWMRICYPFEVGSTP